MKTILKFLFVLMIAVSTHSGFAQNPADDPKYGATPEERTKTLTQISLFSEYVKQQNYKDALPAWRYVFTKYPQASKNIFIAGEKMFTSFIEDNEKQPTIANAYLDTLMLVYNKRIEFFGEKGYVLGRQGVNLLRYGKDRFPEAYKYLHESVELEGLETSAATASTMMQTSAAMFKAGKHEAIQVVADFGLAMDIIEPATEAERIKAAKSTDEKEKGKAEHRYQNLKLASKNVEILFVNSGAASCTHLVKYYSEKFAQAPTDIKLLQKITKVLGDAECDDSELFAKAAEQQHKLDPSARSAYSLARMFAKKEDYDKSVAYFKQAIDLERKADAPNGDFISKAAYQLGGVYFVKKQFSEARSACREAIKAEPGWGKPYILIGKLYASSGATCTNSENLDQGAVYWAAVDKFVQAKQVDNDVEAECNDLISRYKKYYPKKDEAFFYGITKGQSYSIGCWIGETTTARFE